MYEVDFMFFLILLCILVGVVLVASSVIVISAIVHYLRRPITKLYQDLTRRKDYCSLDRLPKRLISMLLIAEDDEFYRHNGINIRAIKEAIQLNCEEKKLITSGSTITQQLVKNLYFTFHKRLWRKLQEALLSQLAERKLSKNEILEMYLNIIYYGCGQYGILSASDYYFGKKPEDLSVNQMFMLIRILNAPTSNNPLTHPENYRKSRDRRANSWERCHILTSEEADLIRSYDVSRLDRDLREPADEANIFVRPPALNERYGPRSGFGKEPFCIGDFIE